MKLWTNGTIHTLVGYDAYNILTDNGLIVGINVPTEKHYDIVDLKGGHLYPGFTDAHLHLIGYGQHLSRIDVSNDSKAQIIALIKTNPKNPILLDGYQASLNMCKQELDYIDCNKPILLRHSDYHAVTVNQVVLDELSIKSETGILKEDLAQKAIEHYSKVSNTQLEQYLRDAIGNLHRFGVTGGHSDDLHYFNGYKDTLDVYIKVLKELKFRTHLLIHHNVLDDYIDHGLPSSISPFLELGSVKVFFDGTLTSKTALMKNGYRNESSKGQFVTPDFEVIVKKVRQLGLTLAVHVIGDLGLEYLLEILAKYPPKKNQKDRLIHTPWVTEKGISMLKDKQLTIDAQPQFLHSDLPFALEILKEKPDYIFPWKTLMKQGITVSFSSDAPVEKPNPLLGILYATKRTGKDGNIYGVEETISRIDAIKNYTVNAVIQNLGHNIGTIEVGHVADFSVFKENLETVTDDQLKNDLVLMTVIDETIVHQN